MFGSLKINPEIQFEYYYFASKYNPATTARLYIYLFAMVVLSSLLTIRIVWPVFICAICC